MKKSLVSVQFRTREIQPDETNTPKTQQFSNLTAMATKYGCQKFVVDSINTFFMFSTFAEAVAFKEEVKRDVDFIRIN